MMLSNRASLVAGAALRLWLRLFGKRVPKAAAPWLAVPVGGNRIGQELYAELAANEGLRLVDDGPAGLMPDFDALRSSAFDPLLVHPEVRRFYERTSLYQLEAWSETSPFAHVFLWLLVNLLSRHMEQLNFPLSPLDMSRGMTSRVIPLVDGSGHTVYTGWLRTLEGTGRVIYAGLYGIATPPGENRPCVRVSFPVPRGSATVLLRPEAQPDGALKLISSGKAFGDAGFYRMLSADPLHWRVRYLRTLHESFHVYLDASGVLRTDHRVSFMGVSVLRLHYKMTRLPTDPAARSPAESSE
jgi:hypothetical protein